MNEESESEDKTLVYVLVAVGALGGLVVCSGIVAAIAIPQFAQTVQKSKAAEAKATLQSTLGAVRSHYHREGSLPGMGMTIRTSETTPTEGAKTTVSRNSLTERELKLWRQLDWPEKGAEMYFQYVYSARETAQGGRAHIEGRADFVPGGPKHTVSATIRVDDGKLRVENPVTSNTFE